MLSRYETVVYEYETKILKSIQSSPRKAVKMTNRYTLETALSLQAKGLVRRCGIHSAWFELTGKGRNRLAGEQSQ